MGIILLRELFYIVPLFQKYATANVEIPHIFQHKNSGAEICPGTHSIKN
jgi:hypothetical protein